MPYIIQESVLHALHPRLRFLSWNGLYIGQVQNTGPAQCDIGICLISYSGIRSIQSQIFDDHDEVIYSKPSQNVPPTQNQSTVLEANGYAHHPCNSLTKPSGMPTASLNARNSAQYKKSRFHMAYPLTNVTSNSALCSCSRQIQLTSSINTKPPHFIRNIRVLYTCPNEPNTLTEDCHHHGRK